MLEKQCMCGFENGYHSKVCPFPLYRKDKPAITSVWQEEYQLNKRMEHKKGCPAREGKPVCTCGIALRFG